MDSYPIGEVYFALCKSFDTPRSLGAWLRFKYGEHKQLAECSAAPGDYTSPDDFFSDYLVFSYLSKYKGLNTGVDTKEVALASFRAAEEKCRATNGRFRNPVTGLSARANGMIHAASRKIARVLGPFSKFCFSGDERWGPHAAFDVSRREAQVDTKMTKIPFSVSRSALAHFTEAIRQDIHWCYSLLGVFPSGPFSFMPDVFTVVEHARVETVPKSAKTDRVIAVEPRGNGFLQKAVGSYIRKRLRRVGIDLNDQQPNADAARRGVADGLCTLDLRSASDTISSEVVFALLPVDWALYLDDIRTKRALLPSGEEIKLEKFSSMGNGFTFELESLIFWALASASVEEDGGGEVLVYGDDIVCPCSSREAVVALLQECGFETNDQKSFGSESQFRESCGKHYFGSVDVTPVYQKEELTDSSSVIRAGNRLIRCALRYGEGTLDPRFHAAWNAVRRLDPLTWRYTLPLGTQGDGGWAVPRDLLVVDRHCPNRGSRVQELRQTTVTFPGDPASLLAYTLRSSQTSSDGCGDDVHFPTSVPVTAYRWCRKVEGTQASW